MSKLNTRKSIGGMRRGSLLNVGKNTKTEKSEFFSARMAIALRVILPRRVNILRR